jgi:hypothetical protein
MHCNINIATREKCKILNTEIVNVTLLVCYYRFFRQRTVNQKKTRDLQELSGAQDTRNPNKENKDEAVGDRETKNT